MAVNLQLDTQARLFAAAHARGKTSDEVVASLLSVLPADAGEGDLLRENGQGLPGTFWNRYRLLTERREQETLTPNEQAELIGLTDQTEELTLQRTRALVELSQRRGVPLRTLVQKMGIRPTQA